MIKVTLKAKQKVTRRDVSNLHYARDIVIVAKNKVLYSKNSHIDPKSVKNFK